MLLSEGAEARIYSERVFGKELLVKAREPKSYRIVQLDTSIRRWRTRNEARVMRALYLLNIPIPRIFAVGEYTIYMEKLDGKLMKDSAFGRNEISECGKVLAKMHNNGIVHGDFTPANIMVNKGNVLVIDFGLSEFSKDVEEKALDLLLMKRAISPVMYKVFERSYSSVSNNSKAILSRLAEIERRGRYQSRTLT